MTSPDRRAVLEEVAARIPAPGRPVLVAVDGVDGAGKTTFADELAAVVRDAGPFGAVVRASVDGFHHARTFRHAEGRTGQSFWARSFDYAAFMRELVEPWRRGPGSPYRPAVHDVDSDEPLDLPPAAVPVRGLLVVDGVFTQRDELRGQWDLAVFLDVPFEVSVPRLARRDGTVADPAHQDQARYVEGQRLYFDTCDPRARADVVVDNSDLDHPRVV